MMPDFYDESHQKLWQICNDRICCDNEFWLSPICDQLAKGYRLWWWTWLDGFNFFMPGHHQVTLLPDHSHTLYLVDPDLVTSPTDMESLIVELWTDEIHPYAMCIADVSYGMIVGVASDAIAQWIGGRSVHN